MKTWDDKVIHAGGEGSRFVALDTNSYIEKVEHQINRSSTNLILTQVLNLNRTVNNCLGKWSDNITDEWKEFIRPDHCNTGKRYVMVKKHKADNLVRVITSNCNTTVDKLSELVEKTLHPLADRLNSKIKDTNNMLEIINDINNSGLSENCVLVSFDVVNMFSNMDHQSDLLSVKEF